jgi:hypothetical protein
MQNKMQAQPQTQRHLAPNSQATHLMQLGREQNWPLAVLGIAPLPRQPVRLQDWLLVPAHLDNSDIPERALTRIQTIYEVGIRPQGFVLVHEAPMQLPAPGHDDAEVIEGEFQELKPGVIEIDWKKLTDTGVGVAGIALKTAATAVVAVGSVVLPALFVMGAALLDPILVAVTEEDVWIEIDRWWV